MVVRLPGTEREPCASSPSAGLLEASSGELSGWEGTASQECQREGPPAFSASQRGLFYFSRPISVSREGGWRPSGSLSPSKHSLRCCSTAHVLSPQSRRFCPSIHSSVPSPTPSTLLGSQGTGGRGASALGTWQGPLRAPRRCPPSVGHLGRGRRAWPQAGGGRPHGPWLCLTTEDHLYRPLAPYCTQ